MTGPATLGPGEAFGLYSEGDATGGFKQRDILFWFVYPVTV